MKKTQKIAIILCSILVVTIALFFIFRGAIQFQSFAKLGYQEKSNLDYRVYLKENDYFEEKYLGKGKQYIAGLIDYIVTDFHYEFDVDEKINYTYTYNITGDLVAHEKDDESKVLYEKSFLLLKDQSFYNKDSSQLKINESVHINYQEYNQIINSFKKDYALTLNSYLLLKLNITINGNYEGIAAPITITQSIDFKIPVSEQTVNVSMNYKDLNNQEVIEQKTQFGIGNKFLFFMFILFIGVDIGLIVYLILVIKKGKTQYEKKLDKIKKEYDRAIVEIEALPNFEGVKVIQVHSFEELLDARENLEKPILHKREKDKEESRFLIVDRNIIYLYLLKSE